MTTPAALAPALAGLTRNVVDRGGCDLGQAHNVVQEGDQSDAHAGLSGCLQGGRYHGRSTQATAFGP
jgi:hypothetical protein